MATLKEKNKYDKRKFIAAFCVAMALFAAIRHGFSINIPMPEAKADNRTVSLDTIYEETKDERIDTKDERPEARDKKEIADSIEKAEKEEEKKKEEEKPLAKPSSQLKNNAHKVVGVWSWVDCFPDSQSVQILAAEKNGIKPCRTREQAQKMIVQHKLVNISNSPYYIVDDLKHSMPYLTPKAQHMLNTICLNFLDSLQIKGVPLHLPMISSVFRTTNDVATLQRGNKNATTNSCHCYGTTVDITYNRFMPMTGHYNSDVELTRWDLPMKQVMAEVLRDLREQGLIYVKYERKQGCFHLTVR